MKDYFNKVVDLIKENKLTALYIVLGILVVFLILVSIFVALNKNKETVSYEKGDFVHKVLKRNNDIKMQLATAVCIGLVIAIIVFAALKSVITVAILLGVYVLAKIYKLCLKINIYYNRVEYNMHEIYSFRFLRKPIVLKWDDLDKVYSKGQAQNRVIYFVGKNNAKIKVRLNLQGGYEFMIFAEGKLEGKKFEAIKIAKGRQ